MRNKIRIALSVIAAVILCFCVLSGCGKKKEKEIPPEPSPTVSPAETQPPKETKPPKASPTPTPEIILDAPAPKIYYVGDGSGSGVEYMDQEEPEPASTPKPTDAPETTPAPELIEIPDPAELDYETYCFMSSEAQFAFFQSFDDPMDYIRWLDAAKAEYEALHPVYEIGPGDVIDLGT